jgi:hypothetical protein
MLQRAPVGVIAEISAGIARQARRQLILSHHIEKLMERCISRSRSGLSAFNRCTRRAITINVWKQDRMRVARARLDTDVTPAARQTEYEDHVRVLRQQFRQIAIDRGVGGRKDVARDLDVSECGAAPACERSRQAATRVRWRAGKRPEACDDNAYPISFLLAHDLFRKPVTHFSGSCVHHGGDLLYRRRRCKPAGGNVGLDARQSGFQCALGA